MLQPSIQGAARGCTSAGYCGCRSVVARTSDTPPDWKLPPLLCCCQGWASWGMDMLLWEPPEFRLLEALCLQARSKPASALTSQSSRIWVMACTACTATASEPGHPLTWRCAAAAASRATYFHDCGGPGLLGQVQGVTRELCVPLARSSTQLRIQQKWCYRG